MDSSARLGTYEIEGFLTDIGFDDLYLGRDTRDDAEVVIRALPVFVDEETVIERLRERARRIAVLQHPAVVVPSRIEKSDGVVLAVMPRQEGVALDHFIPADGLLSRDIFELSIALADALAALHADDLIHGYLHAGRVVAGRDRKLRLLVIGAEEAERRPPARAAAYRAPEVHAGGEVDARAEVFSLGVLLHQIATGELPFSGERADDVARSVQRDDPAPITAGRADLPRELAVIVARCLKKDRELRYGSVQDVHADLGKLREDIVEGNVAIPRRGPGEVKNPDGAPADEAGVAGDTDAPPTTPLHRGGRIDARLVAGGALLLVAGFVLGSLLGGDEAAPPAGDVAALTPATFEPGPELFPRLSPDGERLYYARAEGGDWGIYARSLGGAQPAEPVELTADSAFGDSQPALSFDGASIAFRSERDGGGIFLMGSDGSNVRRLLDSGYNPSFSPDGTHIAVAQAPVYDAAYPGVRGGILIVDAADGTSRAIPGTDGLQPAWSPDGGRIAYWASRGATASDIWTVAADGSGAPLAVTVDAAVDWSPAWSPAGNYLYFASDRSGSTDIWRVPIDQGSGAVRGPAEQVTSGGSVRVIHPSFARGTGTMVYAEASEQRRLYRIPFDPGAGRITGPPALLADLPRDTDAPDLSADGGSLAFIYRRPGAEQIQVAALSGGPPARIAPPDGGARHPRLSPRGDRIAYLAARNGYPQLWTADTRGGEARPLTELTTRKVSAPVWSRDGTGIAMTVGARLMPSHTLLFSADRSPEEQVARTMYTSPADATFEPNSWSRDGVRLAGSIRDRDGRVSGVAVLGVDSGQFQQLTSWGAHPVWLRDGRRLLFQWGGSLYLLDSRALEPEHLFSSVPDVLGETFSLSSDDRWIYVSLERKEADAWLRSR